MKTRKMKKIKGTAVLALTGALVSALAYAADYGRANNPGKGGTFTPLDEYIACVEAVQQVDLLPQVDGFIKEIKFREGDAVKAGDVLYVLDDERYRAVANLRRAELMAAEAEARRAERYWARMQKADARAITQKERDDAEADAERAKAAVQVAKANLKVAEYDLKKTKVIAPISGQIGKTSAHVGDYVAPSKGPLARIVQVDPDRVAFPLTDRAYLRLNLPKAKKEEQDPEEEKKPLTVSIDKENKIYLDDVQLGGINDALDKLKSTLREHVALNPDVAVFVRGDREVKYDEIMKVVNAVRECKVQRMFFVPIDMTIVPPWAKKTDDPDPDPNPSKLRPKLQPKNKIPEKKKVYVVNKDALVKVKESETKKKAPDPKKGKGTAAEDPLKNIDWQKMLDQGYRYGTRTKIASSEGQRCVSLIAEAIRREWDKEEFSWHSGLRSIEMKLQLGAGGVVRGFSIKSSSGDGSVDRTAQNALARLKGRSIPGLTSEFIKQYPELDLYMEPKQGQ